MHHSIYGSLVSIAYGSSYFSLLKFILYIVIPASIERTDSDTDGAAVVFNKIRKAELKVDMCNSPRLVRYWFFENGLWWTSPDARSAAITVFSDPSMRILCSVREVLNTAED